MEAAGKDPSIAQAWTGLLSIAILFCNQLPLAEGMTLTLLLTPVWIFWLHRNGSLLPNTILSLIALLLLFSLPHLLHGAQPVYYLISTTMILSAGFFTACFYKIANSGIVDFDRILRQILVLNFLLTLIAIVALWIPDLRNTFWYVMSMSENIKPIPRLKLFTSEASHYSFLWSLPVIYFIARILFFKVRNPIPALIMIGLPLALSLSFGVLTALFISGILMFLVYRKTILASTFRRKTFWISLLFFAGAIALFFYLFPENPLLIRIENIFSGKDTSARGRTYESFILAHKIITANKSLLWGIGPGQLKLVGRDIIIQYYYYANIPTVIRIPNVCAETIVCFGYLGLILRFLILIFLFFRTRVAANPFRLWLFLFVFVYQFTGSYITNVNEYLLWAVAFSPMLFRDFENCTSFTHKHPRPL